jgi:hydroxymethylpyrimidine/phosphomethylpyrimidine kinase
MSIERPYVMTIAGFDPSGGAGLLADCKTFEKCDVQGFGICSGITYQNDLQFVSVDWLTVEQIKKQIEILFKRFDSNWVKIGIIESFDMLENVIDFIKSFNIKTNIIWDPILVSSSGFAFHEKLDSEKIKDLASKIFLITPNLKEAKELMNESSPEKGAEKLSRFCKVYLKGGHGEGNFSQDILFESGKQTVYSASREGCFPKHGSGCIFSAALTAQLANGKNIYPACEEAKKYVTNYLKSSNGLLGIHQLN